MRYIFSIFILLCLGVNLSKGQTCFSLNEIATQFQNNSFQVNSLKKKLTINSLKYKSTLSQYKWQSKIGLDMPYNKSIESVVKGDGTVSYVQREFINPQLNLTTSRKLLNTGGEIGLQNNLGLLNNLAIGDRQFNSNWFNLFINQPLFSFNESKSNFKRSQLELSIDSLNFYKDKASKLKEFMTVVLDMQLYSEKANLLSQNIKYLNEQQSKLKMMYKAGKILASDTLQSNSEIENTTLELKQIIDSKDLKSIYISQMLTKTVDFNICDFSKIPIYLLDEGNMVQHYQNSNYAKELILDSFVAMQNIKKSKMAYGISTNIYAGIGANKSATTAQGIFNSPSQRQNVSITTSVPLTNWNNYARGNEIAKIEKELFEQNKMEVQQKAAFWSKEQINKYNYLIKNYNNIKKNIALQEELIRIAQLKLEAGKITFYDLNKILLEKKNREYQLLEQIKNIQLFKYELYESTLVDWSE